MISKFIFGKRKSCVDGKMDTVNKNLAKTVEELRAVTQKLNGRDKRKDVKFDKDLLSES